MSVTPSRKWGVVAIRGGWAGSQYGCWPCASRGWCIRSRLRRIERGVSPDPSRDASREPLLLRTCVDREGQFLKVMVSASKGELRKEQIISCDCQVVTCREKGSQSQARILLGVTPVMLNVAIHPPVDPRLSLAAAFLSSTGFVTAVGTLLKIGETAITPVEAKASARVCLNTTCIPFEPGSLLNPY